MMKVIPVSLKEANAFVVAYHRHSKETAGHKFSIGIDRDNELIGVAIVGRPVARKLDDKKTVEVLRLCVKDGFTVENLCSRLYAACARASKEMGYSKIITYTKMSESGSSLRGAGWKLELENAGGTKWNSSGTRIRSNESTDLFGTSLKYPDELKKRWAKYL